MRLPSFLLASLFVVGVLPGQDRPLPADSAVKSGQLANGLRYWIRHNSEPAERLELRLVVRAGSILEDADQLGMAHFVEHMAFNGTTHFAKNDLIEYLQSVGVRFGADLNASTSFDETIYILPVPSDKPEVVAQAFDILRDWAVGIQFDSSDVVGERGVILGEWRSGLGAATRVRDKEFPLLFQGSRYADRMPIGDPAVIAAANPGPLRRFYRDWYRPDLMAVIAVGDFPVAQIESLISSRFGDLPRDSNVRERPDFQVPEIPGTRVSTVTDPEITSESVQLLIRRPSHGYTSEADERLRLINALFSNIAGDRLEEVGRHTDAPFTFAFFGPSRLVRNIEIFALNASAKDGKTAAAFEAVLLEQRRLALHGVLPAELERAKADLLRGHERMAREADKTPSGYFVGEYIGAFLGNEVPVSALDAYAIATRLLPTITVNEVNAAIKDAAQGTDRFIALRAPEKAGQVLPDRDQLLAILSRTDTATVAPWTESNVEGPLVAAPPTPGRVVSEIEHPTVGMTEWRLSNGIRVLVKPTNFKADEIRMSATRPGGFSNVSPEDAFQGSFGSLATRQSGVGAFDPPSLARRLAGKVVTVFANVGDTEEGFSGNTSPADLATFFEVFWLTATQPRYDSAAVSAVMERLRPAIANRDRTPTSAFSDTITLVMGQGNPRSQPIDLARFETLNPKLGAEIFNSRFADFSDFTFLFVGNVTLDSLRPLVEQWIGGLPTSSAKSMWRDVTSPSLPGVITKVVLKGREPVSQQMVVFNGPATSVDVNERLAALAAAEILESRLLEQLREAMGATYGVSAAIGLNGIPRPTYGATISFTSTPEQADTLWLATRQAITTLQDRGPTTEELAKFVTQQRRTMETNVRTNNFWVTNLTQRVRTGESFSSLADWSARLDALTTDAVTFAARRYLDLRRMARFVLLPETTATP